jgi:protein SCO1/2
VRGAIDDLESGDRERVRAFALSVDPDNDTPDNAQEFLLSRRVRGYIDYLLGTRRELQPVWRKYGFAPQTETQEHNSYVVLLDGDGHQRVGFPLQYLTPEALTHDIELLLRRPA